MATTKSAQLPADAGLICTNEMARFAGLTWQPLMALTKLSLSFLTNLIKLSGRVSYDTRERRLEWPILAETRNLGENYVEKI